VQYLDFFHEAPNETFDKEPLAPSLPAFLERVAEDLLAGRSPFSMRSNRAKPFLSIGDIAADTCEGRPDSQITNAAGIFFINGNNVDYPLVDEPSAEYRGRNCGLVAG